MDDEFTVPIASLFSSTWGLVDTKHYKMIKELHEALNKLNETDFIHALYNGKIEKKKHIERLQKVLELMGVKNEETRKEDAI